MISLITSKDHFHTPIPDKKIGEPRNKLREGQKKKAKPRKRK
jgi:hypothetical protein